MKNNKIINNISVILTVILLLTLIGGAIYLGVNSFQNNTGSAVPDITDTVKPDVNDNNKVVAIDKMGNPILANSVIPMQNFAFTCSENSLNKSITLNATVSPETATNKKLNWTATWVNANSDFAKNKNVNDYVTLAVNGDTSNCTVSFVNNFGEAININCVSAQNPSVSAKCKVDCVEKLSITNFKCYEGTDNGFKFSNSFGVDPTVLNILDEPYDSGSCVDISSTIGTIKDPYLNFSNFLIDYTLKFTDEFLAVLNNNNIKLKANKLTSPLNITDDPQLAEYEYVTINGEKHAYVCGFNYFISQVINPADRSQYPLIKDLVIQNSDMNHIELTFDCKSELNPCIINAGAIKINPNAFNIGVSGVTLNQNTAKF